MRSRAARMMWLRNCDASESYDPWIHLARLQETRALTLLWHDDGPLGFIDYGAATISLQRQATRRVLRSTLAHELAHFTRGEVPRGHQPVEEVLTNFTAAARLVPAHIIRDLPELVEKHGRAAARDFLNIDADSLRSAVQVTKLGRRSGWDTADAMGTEAARA